MATRRSSALFFSFYLIHLFDLGASFAFFPNSGIHRTPLDHRRGLLRLDSNSYESTSIKYRIQYRLSAKNDRDEDDEDDDDIKLDNEDDWRSFRAKLVMGENAAPSTPPPSTSTSTIIEDDFDGIGALFQEAAPASPAPTESQSASSLLQGMTPLDPSQWAYDSGKVIEEGAVILGGVEQNFGFGLRQQYFHKAAILVLEHEDKTFTKGIILNRPTDLLLEDDINPGVKWRAWFGGDVQGFGSGDKTSIVCLHSLKSRRVAEASIPVMKDIQWTTFENAKKLVKTGACKPEDFQVFVGYAGWAPGQLMGELERKSWYMVATDSQTLLKELARLGAGSDPRDAGLETWDLLMNMIGRHETARQYSGGFDDLILKEWALQHLLSEEAGGGAGAQSRSPMATSAISRSKQSNPIGRLFQRNDPVKVKVGSLVRASSAERSPFLLENQELHKSIILIIAEDEQTTIGAILNRPVTRGLDIKVSQKETGESRRIVLPLRYGGQYSVKGNESLLWLHCNPSLRLARIGSPVGDNKEGIWKCTADDVVSAVSKGLATPEEFLVVTGVSVWSKAIGGKELVGEIEDGRFELIPDKNIPAVWSSLSRQEVLKNSNLSLNLDAAEEAWTKGGTGMPGKKKNGESFPIGGLGEGFDEEDDTLVFKSDVKVARLSDDALRCWISTFLLGGPFEDKD